MDCIASSQTVVRTCGERALIQRCQEHKRHNVVERLPRDMRARVS
jgi:hypothetical protein